MDGEEIVAAIDGKDLLELRKKRGQEAKKAVLKGEKKTKKRRTVKDPISDGEGNHTPPVPDPA